MVRTRGLTKDFTISRKTTVHAARRISLDIEPGELVAVLGRRALAQSPTALAQ